MRTAALISALAAIAIAAPAVRQSCTPDGGKCAGAPNFEFVPYAPCCSATLVCAPRTSPPAGTWGSFCIPAVQATSSTPAAPTNGTAAPTVAAATTAAGRTTAAGPTTAATPETTGAPVVPVPGGRNSTTAAPVTTAAVGRNSSDATTTPAPTVAAEPTASPNATATTAPNATETTAPNATTLPNATKLPNASTSDNGSKCFPSFATVELEDGSMITMDKLSIGDMVKVGANAFSKVFMFTHKTQMGTHEFVELTTSSGARIALTSGHYIPVDGSLVSAGEVAVGTQLQLGTGVLDTVVSIRSVSGTGLYNPQTIEGNVVVDGVVASTYTTAVAPRFAHAILAPLRTLSTVLRFDFTLLESGGGLLAGVAPRGQSVF